MPIVVDHITHTYMPGSAMEHVALNDVCFTVNEGEFWGIIGHTGSGKSTLLQHLNGLMLPQKGRVLVDGFDMNEKKQRKEGRSRVGMVFQYPEYQLFEETVEKDVAFGPKNLGLSEEEIADRVEEALALVGLAPELFKTKSPFDLSGGEKRRAALAGILAMRPRYLVLDEPMAGLDPKGRESVMDMIVNLRKRTGCAVIMVSHSMDDVAAHAERVLVMREGKVAMEGAPDTVFRKPEALLEMGLDVPQAARLAIALRERGAAVPEEIYQEAALIAWIREHMREAGHD